MAHTPDTVKAQIQADIAASNAKTGATDATLHEAVNRLIDGFGAGSGGITPTGKIKLTSNGTHDVTNYAEAEVAVPASGITPTGTKDIASNGTHDVVNYANANVNIEGLNAKIFTTTISADVTSGAPTLLAANSYIKSLKTKPNSFVFVRYTGVKASTAMLSFWFFANFPLWYNGATAYKSLVARTTASATTLLSGTYGLESGENYNGHLCCDANGKLYLYVNSTYPLKAGEYQIIAGTVEML